MTDFTYGSTTIRPFDLERDVERAHAWLTHPRSHFWGMQTASLDDVRAAYERIGTSPHEDAWIGEIDGVPTFLVETYAPAHHPLAEHLDVGSGDLGMHILVAPPTGQPVRGLTSLVMQATMSFCFARGAERVVVEPDVRNTAIHAKNAAVGFLRVADVDLPDKRAALSVCTRADFERSQSPAAAWQEAERIIVAKALGEFAHELLITPEPTGPRSYRVVTDAAEWAFDADRFRLDHWSVDPASVTRRDLPNSPNAEPLTPTATQLVFDLREALALDGDLLSTYLEELMATVAHRARTLTGAEFSSRYLSHAPAHVVEAAMSEGHPCFVATNGRIGFSATDLETYPPEAARDLRPLWIAVPKETSLLARSARFDDEDSAYEAVLGRKLLDELREDMRERGLDPTEQRLLPVHPWQWDERVRTTFADDVAHGRIVALREDQDAHRPAQSIRTWLNIDSPQRPYVKMALAVRNMGFVRGLSPKYMSATPAINDYVASIVRGDAELKSLGFDVLTEYAAIGYTGDVYHRLGFAGPQTRMIAALWRETPAQRQAGRAAPSGESADMQGQAPGHAPERTMTMAALLHRDPQGVSVVSELIAASGIDARTWLDNYLRAYVRPIVHLLCRHRLAFIPHGENIILRLRDHRVVGVYLKDIGEEVGFMDDGHGTPLPDGIERIRVRASADEVSLGLFTDVFDGFLRFLGPLLVADGLLTETEFWNQVRDCVTGYAADHPNAAASLLLFTPTFERSCLNRLQLRNPLEMVSLDDTVGSLIKSGQLENPIATS